MSQDLSKFKQIRLESDGSAAGTKIVDVNTGEDLKLPIEHIEWELSAGGIPRCKLVLGFAAANIDVPLEEITIEAVPNRVVPYFGREENEAQLKLNEAVKEYYFANRQT